MAGKVAYVPQVLLVEGKRVLNPSAAAFLWLGNVSPDGDDILHHLATYSALMILAVPLIWYGYLNGVNLEPWNATQWPVWYAIAGAPQNL